MKLTPRREEIIKCMIDGKTSRQIADKFCLEEKTIRRHKEIMYDQLNLHGDNPQAKLIAWYMRTYGHNRDGISHD
jgi:DNA-binding NarL/FixJ family response regulator